MDALYQFGIALIQFLQNNFSPALDGFMNAFTFMGRIEFYLVLVPFIYWVLDRRIGIRTFLVLLYVDTIATSFKLLLHQPRPYWIGDVKPLSTETSYGIPSSHASDSLAVQGYLASRVKKTWFWVLVVVLVFFISISRLYLGVHFPQDTLFGWVIGLFVLWTLSQWGDEVVDWFRSASLSAQIGIGFVVSLVIALTGILIRLIISGIPDPVSWSSFSTQARSIDHFITLSGALFGMIAGYALTRQYARFSAKGNWSKRLIRYILGIVGLLLLYYGLDLVFSAIAPDETTLGYLLRYIRYGAATFWATFLAPWIFLKTRLADLESG